MAYTIRGIKMSDPLALIRICGLSQTAAADLFGRVAEKRINLALAAQKRLLDRSLEISLCVGAGQAMTAYTLAAKAAQAHGLDEPGLIQGLVSLTVYPRGKGLGFPLALEAVLCQAGVKCVGLSSSLSSCVVLVSSAQADQAARVLAKEFNLPVHASPKEARVPVVQAP